MMRSQEELQIHHSSRAGLKVGRAWALKEAATRIWTYSYRGWALKYFKHWHFWATHSRLKPMIRVAKTMKRYLPWILNYLRHRSTDGGAETIDAKIQEVKYRARSSRNRGHFRRAILFRHGTWPGQPLLTASVAPLLRDKILGGWPAQPRCGKVQVKKEMTIMMWLRRVRGAIGMGLTWAAAWFAAGMIMMLGFLLVTGSTGADVPYPLGFGAFGFAAGVTFSGVLGLVDSHRRFDQMSLPRFAGWGAAGGFLLSAIFVVVVALAEEPAFLWNLVVLGPLFAAAGAGSAAGALALARTAGDGG